MTILIPLAIMIGLAFMAGWMVAPAQGHETYDCETCRKARLENAVARDNVQ